VEVPLDHSEAERFERFYQRLKASVVVNELLIVVEAVGLKLTCTVLLAARRLHWL